MMRHFPLGRAPQRPLPADDKRNFTRRTFLLGSGGVAMGTALAACSSSPSSSGGGSGKGLKSVSLLLDFLPNLDDVFVNVAQRMGYFADEGLDVTTTNPSNAQINSIAELTGLGRFDFGMQAVPEGIFARNAGSPVLGVSGWGHRSEGIISLDKNPVTGPESLVGKTVVTYNAVDYEAFMISFMASAGLSTSQVNLVNTDFTAPLIASGKAYAGLGIYQGERIDTMAEAKVNSVNFLSFFNPYPDKYGIPEMNYLMLYTSESYANSNPDIVKGFVRAMARGYKKAITMPTSELSPIMNTWCSTGPNATGALSTNMEKFAASGPFNFYGTDQNPDTAQYFQMPLDTIPQVVSWMEKDKVAKSINLSDFATNEFITPGALNPSV
jgi:putative hydroxymethylpyrimidine transport system substrate-binding protein